MADEGITSLARAFIAQHIESVMQLELVLLLHARRERAWTTGELAGELRIDPAWVDGQLHAMDGWGLVRANPGPPTTFAYAPRSPDLDRAVDDLSHAYADRRVSVIGLIFSKPSDKLRSFADAFRIRKEPPGG